MVPGPPRPPALVGFLLDGGNAPRYGGAARSPLARANPMRFLLPLLISTLLLGCTIGGELPLPAPYSSLPEERADRLARERIKPPPTPNPHLARLEERENTYADGSVRTRWLVRVDPDGKEVRHGGLLRFHANGKISLRGFYRNGHPTGVWSWFDDGGRLLRTAAPQGDYDEILSGIDLEDPNTIYRDAQGRKIAQGLRKYNLPHGEWTYYHPDGSVSAQGHYVNGQPDGRWVFYFSSGLVERQEDYKLGVPEGEVLRGWPNGQEQLEGRVEQGLRVGRWRTWYRDGQIESDGPYREDRRSGEWRFWDEQGRLVRHTRYAHGTAVQELPLPLPRVSPPPSFPEAQLLPFRPRIYDESGDEIKLKQDGIQDGVPGASPARASR
jgi:antitoxin component YwqK of YwqJK toxin-antitoxin module